MMKNLTIPSGSEGKQFGMADLLQILQRIMKVCTSVEVDGSLWDADLFWSADVAGVDSGNAIGLQINISGVMISRIKTSSEPKGRFQKWVHEKEDTLKPVIIVTPVIKNGQISALSISAVAGTCTSSSMGFLLKGFPCRKEIRQIRTLIEEGLSEASKSLA